MPGSPLRRLHSIRSRVSREVVGAVALPRRARQQADEEDGHDGQDAVDEDCGDDFGLASCEADERGCQAELPESAVKSRQRY